MLRSVELREIEAQDLLINLGTQYSKYFKIELNDQISKLQEFIEESVAKLEELQSLFEMTETENKEWLLVTIPALLKNGKLLYDNFNQRLDTLQKLIKTLKTTLDQLELQLSEAESALGMTSSFRSMFKYFRKSESHVGIIPIINSSNFQPIQNIKLDQFLQTADDKNK